MQGCFIVFEGPDGSGTSRQSEFFAAKLKNEGISCILTAEPTEGKIGREIRKMLHETDNMLSPEAIQLLFCADRSDHVDTVIRPALEAGITVVTDRYTLSTIIYGKALGLDAEWLATINAHFPTPDCTVITLPPFEVSLERMLKREKLDSFETKDFQKKIYKEYAAVQQPNCIIVDTSGKKEENAEFIWNSVQKLL